MDNAEATKYLSSMLGKNLIIRIGDGRIFIGTFRCTDKDRNIVLEYAHEYRVQATSQLVQSPVGGGKSKNPSKLHHTSRYVGLIVVPGQHIEDIQLEEFDASLIV